MHSLLKSHLWLPVNFRMQFKISLLTIESLMSWYLILRSNISVQLNVPHIKSKNGS